METTFKIGDRVRVVKDKLVGSGYGDAGKTGTVTGIDSEDVLPIQVKLDAPSGFGRKFNYDADELEAI